MRFTPQDLQLLAGQAGVVARRQLLEEGWTGGQVDAALRHRHLRRVGHGVYLRTGVAFGSEQRAMAAVLRTRTQARITGELLLAMLGCEGYDPATAPFTVLLPRPRRLARAVGFRHRVDPAPDADRARYGALPGTAPARTLVEVAVDLEDDEAVLLAADRLRWRCRVGASHLAEVAVRMAGHPGVARLQRLGLLEPDRPESPGERHLAAVLARGGIEVDRQVWIAPDIRVDVLWREVGVVVEFDGATHLGARDRTHDAGRDDRIRDLGYLPVHLTAADIASPETVTTRLQLIAERVRARHR